MKCLTLFWLSQLVFSLGSSSVSWRRKGENSRVLFAPPVSEVVTSTSNCSIWLNTCESTSESPKLSISPPSYVAFKAWGFPSDLTTVSFLWSFGQYWEMWWTLIVQKYVWRLVFDILMPFIIGVLIVDKVFKPKVKWNVSSWLQCVSPRFRWHWAGLYRDDILKYLSEGENNWV